MFRTKFVKKKEMNAFYIQYTFSPSLAVFEMIKQKRLYAQFHKFVYRKIITSFQIYAKITEASYC
jgi:hypothetical protein